MNTPASQHQSPLLSLPCELRLLILRPLLTSSTPNLRISSLFIRDNYVNRFMTQQTLQISGLALTRVCRQLHDECSPILYSQALWRAGCRFEALASQIGARNLRWLRRLECDADDLPLLRSGLAPEDDSETEGGGGSGARPGRARLSFDGLEMLTTDGYQASAISRIATRRARFEGIRLCRLAQDIMRLHPNLKVLVQETGLNSGRSDAVDLTFGRVRWRFLRKESEKNEDEVVVDPAAVIELLEALIEVQQQGGLDEHGMWRTGVFRLYPHLGREVTSN